MPSISGNLYIKSEKVTVSVSVCTTVIKVGTELAYRCPQEKTLTTDIVIANQTVPVTASYEPKHNSGTFYQCLGFYQLPDGMDSTLYVYGL